MCTTHARDSTIVYNVHIQIFRLYDAHARELILREIVYSVFVTRECHVEVWSTNIRTA